MGVVIVSVLLLAFFADVRGCVCDPAKPETMQGRECNLTRIATDEAADTRVLFIKDANPTKPNRWLAIPHTLRHTLNEMTIEERTAFWNAAIEKARSLWSDQWGIAVNSEEKRSQCQMHGHIGKVLSDADRSGGVLIDRVEDIPAPPAGAGILILPEGAKFRVFAGRTAPELVLER